MEPGDLVTELESVIMRDPRYRVEAYLFVINALEFTMMKLRRQGHVSGQELLDGIRRLAQREFGPMAKMVFESWGVCKTEDFGEIVFSLIEEGILGKTDRDSKEDFKDVYDFDEAFVKQYHWDVGGAV